MEYDGKMDQECVNLCNSINKISGLETFESCCGHGEVPFRIYFSVKNLENLPILLYYLDPCHVGFKWECKVKTDCAMSPVCFYIESIELGEKSYEEAEEVSKEIEDYINQGGYVSKNS
jgi:hypothetical protein